MSASIPAPRRSCASNPFWAEFGWLVECGAGAGRDVEPEPLPAGLPDFTVPRLGGGQLRWADYAGRPVIAVAGDITQVAPALRRLARLTDGGKSPAVIGLAWDPGGAKEHPAPADEIRRQAGVLPVPVGYPATYPAVCGSATPPASGQETSASSDSSTVTASR